jgi:hypothetical protein
MDRPKSSVIGLVDLGLTARNTVGLNRLTSNVSELSAELLHSNSAIQSQLDIIKNTQLATVAGMFEINDRLAVIERQNEDVLEELKRQEWEKDHLGDLKILLVALEDELEKIDLMAETHLEFAVLYAEDLDVYLKSNNIDYTKFKRMDQTGIKWAKSVIQAVENKRQEMSRRLA